MTVATSHSNQTCSGETLSPPSFPSGERSSTPAPIETSQSPGVGTPPFVRRCRCAKTSCLKLYVHVSILICLLTASIRYCECFAAQRMCGEECGCVTCLNKPEHSYVRNLQIQSITERVLKTRDRISPAPDFKKGETSRRPRCLCIKSRCIKKYCACFAVSVIES